VHDRGERVVVACEKPRADVSSEKLRDRHDTPLESLSVEAKGGRRIDTNVREEKPSRALKRLVRSKTVRPQCDGLVPEGLEKLSGKRELLVLGLHEGDDILVGEEHEMLEGVVLQLREVDGQGLHDRFPLLLNDAEEGESIAPGIGRKGARRRRLIIAGGKAADAPVVIALEGAEDGWHATFIPGKRDKVVPESGESGG
jgi:hypothetical protein